MESEHAMKRHQQYHTTRKVVFYILGILETLFAFRLIFKLLGANPSSGFVTFIYTVTGVFLNPFKGIFSSSVNEGLETSSILEPSVIIAMIVYALIAYGIVVLLDISMNPKKKEIN